jgi:hypothetical protein
MIAFIEHRWIRPDEGRMPFDPFGRIIAIMAPIYGDGEMDLTPNLMTEKEIDEYVEKLITAVNKAGNVLKKRLSASKNPKI